MPIQLRKACWFPILFLIPVLRAQTETPLLPEPTIAALAEELSGEAAHRSVEQLTQWHRQRGSRGFEAATGFILNRLREYGLEEVETWRFPADGKIRYGTQLSRPAWDADFAELWELEETGDGGWKPGRRVASWEARPITLAEDSGSGQVTNVLLIDVGAGTRPEDFQGKEVQGNLVLTSSQPGAVAGLAVDGFGAAGIVSYAQNQRTGWWRQDEDLVRWGHFDTFPAPKTFAFMVSLKQARAWRERLARGEDLHFDAHVQAGQHPGSYDIATGIIRGSDPGLRDQEIVFSCHLDHQRPGANDNASGCATILEVARGLSKLVREDKIPPPRRTLRFVWPPEVEGTLALLNGRPAWAGKVLAAIHLDMVGGGPVTKVVFHVTRSPASLPTFINDVAEAFGGFVNRQSALFADTGEARYPMVAPEGGREPLRADMADLTLGSDHEIYTEGSFQIPAIYLNDWPDRYIHTNADTPANIDPTKLLRAGFIAAASGYYLSRFEASEVGEVVALLRRQALERTSLLLGRLEEVPVPEKANLVRFHFEYLREKLKSLSRFVEVPTAVEQAHEAFLGHLQELVKQDTHSALESSLPPRGAAATVYRRKPDPKGPLSAFGYSYLTDQLSRRKLPTPGLPGYRGLWGGGEEYAYEALNLVDGHRSVQQIRDDLSAIYGPVPMELVDDYLRTLEKIEILER